MAGADSNMEALAQQVGADIGAMQKAIASAASPGAMPGQIAIWPTPYAPVGWVECAGYSLVPGDYPALFAAIGTAHGGDGETSFSLPLLSGAPTGCIYIICIGPPA